MNYRDPSHSSQWLPFDPHNTVCLSNVSFLMCNIACAFQNIVFPRTLTIFRETDNLISLILRRACHLYMLILWKKPLIFSGCQVVRSRRCPPCTLKTST